MLLKFFIILLFFVYSFVYFLLIITQPAEDLAVEMFRTSFVPAMAARMRPEVPPRPPVDFAPSVHWSFSDMTSVELVSPPCIKPWQATAKCLAVLDAVHAQYPAVFNVTVAQGVSMNVWAHTKALFERVAGVFMQSVSRQFGLTVTKVRIVAAVPPSALFDAAIPEDRPVQTPRGGPRQKPALYTRPVIQRGNKREYFVFIFSC